LSERLQLNAISLERDNQTRMRRLHLLCLAVLTACKNTDEPRRDDQPVGSGDQKVPHWNLVEEWRVGGEVTGPLSLTNVQAIRVLPDGRLVIFEAIESQVHILSPRGAPIRTIGRSGRAPGEFSSASQLVLAPDGRIVVYDFNAARLTFLSSNGDLLKTQPHEYGGRVAWVRSDGRLEELGTQFVDGPNGRRESVDFRRTWSPDYATADTVAGALCPLLQRIPGEFTHWASPHPDGGRFFHNYPFLPQARLDVPDGSWVSPFPDFRMLHRVVVGTCASAVTITLQGTPVPVPAHILRELKSSLRAHKRAGDTLSPDPSRVRATLPLFEALFTDTQDRLWVERLVDSTIQFGQGTVFGMASVYAKGAARFEVYSPQGALVAHVSAPSSLGTPRSPNRFVITADRVYTIVFDENSVPYLCSFRIVAPAL
jgi:hypothetical protein